MGGKKTRNGAHRLRGWLGAAATWFVLAAGAGAEEPTLSKEVYDQITGAQTLMEQEQHPQAVAQLRTLLQDGDLSPYETAMVNQTLGYAYAAQEQYAESAAAFRESLDTGTLPEESAQIVRYNMAQILIAAEHYTDGASILEDWLATETEAEPRARVLLAQAYTQLGQYDRAERHLLQAISQATTFQEPWHRLLVSIYVEQEKFSEAAGVLRRLLGHFPAKKTYWMQLSQTYSGAEQHERAASTLAMAYKQGLLREREALQIVSYYLHLGLPYKAAELLADGLTRGLIADSAEHQELLVTCWLHAREYQRALDVLERNAKTAETGEADVRRAEILVQLERWPEAATSASSGISKGGIEEPGGAYLLLGIAEYQAGKLDESTEAFNTATSYKPVAKRARQWLMLLKREQEKQL